MKKKELVIIDLKDNHNTKLSNINYLKINTGDLIYDNKCKSIKFDLTLLGIGNDGHIASLFRDNIANKNNKNVKLVKRKDFLRISLTLKCINNSKNIFLWAPGIKKKNIIEKILSDKKLKYSASFLKVKNNFLFYSN